MYHQMRQQQQQQQQEICAPYMLIIVMIISMFISLATTIITSTIVTVTYVTATPYSNPYIPYRTSPYDHNSNSNVTGTSIQQQQYHYTTNNQIYLYNWTQYIYNDINTKHYKRIQKLLLFNTSSTTEQNQHTTLHISEQEILLQNNLYNTDLSNGLQCPIQYKIHLSQRMKGSASTSSTDDDSSSSFLYNRIAYSLRTSPIIQSIFPSRSGSNSKQIIYTTLYEHIDMLTPSITSTTTTNNNKKVNTNSIVSEDKILQQYENFPLVMESSIFVTKPIIADVNGDGIIDILTTDYDGGITIMSLASTTSSSKTNNHHHHHAYKKPVNYYHHVQIPRLYVRREWYEYRAKVEYDKLYPNNTNTSTTTTINSTTGTIIDNDRHQDNNGTKVYNTRDLLRYDNRKRKQQNDNSIVDPYHSYFEYTYGSNSRDDTSTGSTLIRGETANVLHQNTIHNTKLSSKRSNSNKDITKRVKYQHIREQQEREEQEQEEQQYYSHTEEDSSNNSIQNHTGISMDGYITTDQKQHSVLNTIVNLNNNNSDTSGIANVVEETIHRRLQEVKEDNSNNNNNNKDTTGTVDTDTKSSVQHLLDDDAVLQQYKNQQGMIENNNNNANDEMNLSGDHHYHNNGNNNKQLMDDDIPEMIQSQHDGVDEELNHIDYEGGGGSGDGGDGQYDDFVLHALEDEAKLLKEQQESKKQQQQQNLTNNNNDAGTSSEKEERKLTDEELLEQYYSLHNETIVGEVPGNTIDKEETTDEKDIIHQEDIQAEVDRSNTNYDDYEYGREEQDHQHRKGYDDDLYARSGEYEMNKYNYYDEQQYLRITPHVLANPLLIEVPKLYSGNSNDKEYILLIVVSYYLDEDEYDGLLDYNRFTSDDIGDETSISRGTIISSAIMSYSLGSSSSTHHTSNDMPRWLTQVHLDLSSDYTSPQNATYLDTIFHSHTERSDSTTMGAFALASPTVADIDGDGNPEVIVGTSMGIIYVLDARQLFKRSHTGDENNNNNNSNSNKWPVQMQYPIEHKIIVEDVIGDTNLEVFVIDIGGNVVCFDHNGNIIWHRSLLRSIGLLMDDTDTNNNNYHQQLLFGSSPMSFGDIDGNGILDIVVTIQYMEETYMFVINAINGDDYNNTAQWYPMILKHGKPSTLYGTEELHQKLVQPLLINLHGTDDTTTTLDYIQQYVRRNSTESFHYQSTSSTKQKKQDSLSDTVPPPYGGYGHGLHILQPHGNVLYIIEGTTGCINKILTIDEVMTMILADDIYGTGFIDLLITTEVGNIVSYSTNVPYHPLNTWTYGDGQRNYGHNTMIHGYSASQGVFIHDISRHHTIIYGIYVPVTFEIYDTRPSILAAMSSLKNTDDTTTNNSSNSVLNKRSYKVDIRDGTSFQRTLLTRTYTEPGVYTERVYIPMGPGYYTLSVVMTSSHGLIYFDNYAVSYNIHFMNQFGILLWLPLVIASIIVILFRLTNSNERSYVNNDNTDDDDEDDDITDGTYRNVGSPRRSDGILGR